MISAYRSLPCQLPLSIQSLERPRESPNTMGSSTSTTHGSFQTLHTAVDGFLD